MTVSPAPEGIRWGEVCVGLATMLFAAIAAWHLAGGGDEKAVGADGNGVLSVDRQNIEK